MVRAGVGLRKVAFHFGYTPGAVSKWAKKAEGLPSNAHLIPTRSSRPHHHPGELRGDTVSRILELRRERNQCAEILHYRLVKEGSLVSLSSVKRTLKRNGLVYPSKWKKWHQYPARPIPEKPGMLVQIDSMQEGLAREGLRAYALVDLCSRWAHAVPCHRVNTNLSLRFVEEARGAAPFLFRTLQSDHGPEFSKWFTKRLGEKGIDHRHSRVRTPTDNAHVERFILTLQRECLKKIPLSLRSWRKEIPEFLHWYNTERPHMALGMKTPAEALKCFQAIE